MCVLNGWTVWSVDCIYTKLFQKEPSVQKEKAVLVSSISVLFPKNGTDYNVAERTGLQKAQTQYWWKEELTDSTNILLGYKQTQSLK